MRTKEKSPPILRYDRERWLVTALNVLASEGGARLRIDSLVRNLGVTKGSFYHHFKNREEFVRALIDYWSSEFTEAVINDVSASEASPSERLLSLMRRVEAEGLDQYDIAFRSWAAQDPVVAEALKAVDLRRYEFVTEVFEAIGFEGAELEMRVKLLLVFLSARRSVFTPQSSYDSADKTRLRHEFLTHKR